jgi:transcriptional regulator with XRE-family HTH domain
MIIGDRLRVLREEKKFSQGEIEKRTGLLRCYISRVENGHTVPAVETLEKFARALEVPMYQLFYEGEEPSKPPSLPSRGQGIAARLHKGTTTSESTKSPPISRREQLNARIKLNRCPSTMLVQREFARKWRAAPWGA